MGTDFDQLALLLAFGAEKLANDDKLAASASGLIQPISDGESRPITEQNGHLNGKTCYSNEITETDTSETERRWTLTEETSCSALISEKDRNVSYGTTNQV